MRTVFVIILALVAIAAIAQDTTRPAPQPAPANASAQAEPSQLAMADVQKTIEKLGAQNAANELTIAALQRQVEEWRQRARTSEAKARSCEAQPKTPAK